MSDAPIAEDEQPVADAANDNHNTNDTPDDGPTTEADAGQNKKRQEQAHNKINNDLTAWHLCISFSLSLPSSFSSILLLIVVSRFLPSSCCGVVGDWQWCGGGHDEASDSDECDSIPYNQFLTLP